MKATAGPQRNGNGSCFGRSEQCGVDKYDVFQDLGICTYVEQTSVFACAAGGSKLSKLQGKAEKVEMRERKRVGG